MRLQVFVSPFCSFTPGFWHFFLSKHNVISGHRHRTLRSRHRWPRRDQASRVEGGYQLKGHWAWSSRVDHYAWNIFTAMVTPSSTSDVLERRIFLSPRSDDQILDSWHVASLKASGRHDVIVQDVFVPEHRTVNLLALAHGRGHSVSSSPRYRVPLFSVFPISVTSGWLVPPGEPTKPGRSIVINIWRT
jgi:hypothetical protein